MALQCQDSVNFSVMPAALSITSHKIASKRAKDQAVFLFLFVKSKLPGSFWQTWP